MKIIYTGLESSGKSLMLARTALGVLERNHNWYTRFGFRRLVYSNLRFNDDISSKYKDYIVYFDEIREIIDKTGCDIIFDEISSHFNALKREPLPLSVNKWLRQGAKQGVHFYATAQEFHDIHLDFRRRVHKCFYISKLFGSSRGGDCLPPVSHIWGLCLVRELNIRPYNELAPEFIPVLSGGLSFLFISRFYASIFDTHQVIKKGEELPFEHYVRKCHTCGYTKTFHI